MHFSSQGLCFDFQKLLHSYHLFFFFLKQFHQTLSLKDGLLSYGDTISPGLHCSFRVLSYIEFSVVVVSSLQSSGLLVLIVR